MVIHRPRRQLLTVWRLSLILYMAPPAFFIALIFKEANVWRLVFTGLWLSVFFAAYMWYLPSLFGRQGFRLDADSITCYGGALYRRTHIIPLKSVQFVSLVSSPLDRLFGIRTVTVTAPGSRTVVPGLSADTAGALSDALCGGTGRQVL